MPPCLSQEEKISAHIPRVKVTVIPQAGGTSHSQLRSHPFPPRWPLPPACWQGPSALPLGLSLATS